MAVEGLDPDQSAPLHMAKRHSQTKKHGVDRHDDVQSMGDVPLVSPRAAAVPVVRLCMHALYVAPLLQLARWVPINIAAVPVVRLHIQHK